MKNKWTNYKHWWKNKEARFLSTKNSYLQVNRKMKNSPKLTRSIKRKLPNSRKKYNYWIKATMISLKKLGRRKKLCSNCQVKFTTWRWNWMRKKFRKIKNWRLSILSGRWNMIPWQTSIIIEYSFLKRKSNSFPKELKRKKPKLKNFWAKLNQVKLTDKM